MKRATTPVPHNSNNVREWSVIYLDTQIWALQEERKRLVGGQSPKHRTNQRYVRYLRILDAAISNRKEWAK